MALSSNGNLKSWGDNTYGQLGIGSFFNSNGAVVVSGLSNVLSAKGGKWHAWTYTSSGSVYSWGRNHRGQLGIGSLNTTSVPTLVLSTVICNEGRQITEGNSFTAAVISNGGAEVCGRNTYGQLAQGNTTDYNVPVGIPGLSGNVKMLAAGKDHLLILKADGSLISCGKNTNGQLGNNTFVSSNTPVTVTSSVKAVAAGYNHSLALMDDGTVKAWGLNANGQLGDGTTSNRKIPVTIPGLSGVIAIAAGDNFSMALLSDGSVKAWGENVQGQLGDGSNTQRVSPVTVSGGLVNVKGITAGYQFALALLSNGYVRSWGSNSFGQLGNGFLNSNTPITPGAPPIKNIKDISCGEGHAMALKSDGTVLAWGLDNYSQLGDNNFSNTNAPQAVTGVSNCKYISAGEFSSLALQADGQVPAFGNNFYGQLGNGVSDTAKTARNIPLFSCMAVPIENIVLRAIPNKGNVLLKWESFEAQKGNYIIERRKNGVWEKIAEIPNTLLTDRTWVDKIDLTKTLYRVSEILPDARKIQSNIVFIKGLTQGGITLHPNPANSFVMLKGIEENYKVEVMDETGRIMRVNIDRQAEDLKLHIDPLKPGVYFIRLEDLKTGAPLGFERFVKL